MSNNVVVIERTCFPKRLTGSPENRRKTEKIVGNGTAEEKIKEIFAEIDVEIDLNEIVEIIK